MLIISCYNLRIYTVCIYKSTKEHSSWPIHILCSLLAFHNVNENEERGSRGKGDQV